MNAFRNPLDPKIVTAEDFALMHHYTLHPHSDRRIRTPYFKNILKTAVGMTCKEVLENGAGSGLGAALLFLFLRDKSNIPPEYKGKRVFCTKESFSSEKKGHFILFLDCTGVDPDYGECRIDHPHPFNEKDFFVKYE